MLRIEIVRSVDTVKRLSEVFSVEVAITQSNTQREKVSSVEVKIDEGEKVSKRS